MSRFLGVSMGILLLLGFTMSPVRAGGLGAEKSPLVHEVFEYCVGGLINPPDPLPVNGFVVLNARNGTLTAQVSLKGGLPDTTYRVSVTQTPSGTGCNIYTAVLTTNGRGNGNVRLSQPLVPGDTGGYVDVFNADTFDFYNSPAVPVNSR